MLHIGRGIIVCQEIVNVEELLRYPFNKLTRRTQQRLKLYEICAEDFLKFAIEDSKEGDLRSWVNALGNVNKTGKPSENGENRVKIAVST